MLGNFIEKIAKLLKKLIKLYPNGKKFNIQPNREGFEEILKLNSKFFAKKCLLLP